MPWVTLAEQPNPHHVAVSWANGVATWLFQSNNNHAYPALRARNPHIVAFGSRPMATASTNSSTSG